MGDKKFTFIELHLDGDTQFGPRTLPDLVTGATESEREEDVELEVEEEEAAATSGDDSGRNGAIGVVLGLLALVAVAAAVKKFRGEDEEDLEKHDEPDVIVN